VSPQLRFDGSVSTAEHLLVDKPILEIVFRVHFSCESPPRFTTCQGIECNIMVLLSDHPGLAVVVHKGENGEVSGAFDGRTEAMIASA